MAPHEAMAHKPLQKYDLQSISLPIKGITIIAHM